MPTVKQLREQVKSYGLKGYTKMMKPELTQLITDARQQVQRERIARGVKSGNLTRRYPTIFRPNYDDPQRLEKRRHELKMFDADITADLRARKYEQAVKRNPKLRLAPLRK